MPSRAYAAVAVVIVVVAAAAITALVRTERGAAGCRDAARDVLLVRQGELTAGRLEPAVARLREGCLDSDAPTQAAANLIGMRRRELALPLVRQVVRDEPENYRGWLALSASLPPGERDQAERARRRARALNPLLPR